MTMRFTVFTGKFSRNVPVQASGKPEATRGMARQVFRGNDFMARHKASGDFVNALTAIRFCADDGDAVLGFKIGQRAMH